jgi:DMSO/TMAO reductase YedYZ molybdopterin-dependent catalytic subunit
MSVPGTLSSAETREREETRGRAALAGLAGSCAVSILAGLVHLVVRPLPFPSVSIAQAFVGTASGRVESFFIDRLGHWASRITVIGSAVVFVLSGALIGVILHAIFRHRRIPDWAWWLSLLPVWLISIAFYRMPPQFFGRWGFAVVTFPMYLTGGWVAARTAERLRAPAEATDEGRRVLIRSLGLGAAGAVLGVLDIGGLLFAGTDPGEKRLALTHVKSARTPATQPGDAAFANIPGLTSEITPNGAFYVVDTSLIKPLIDPTTWRLTVGGLVNRPLSLSYPALKRMPAVERYQTLECISNKVGGNLMSNAKWVGVPLREILDRAGVRSGAVEVVFRSAGGYSDSLSIDQAMDASTLIAIGMNDHVLPQAHGFPARLLSVGTYGMKNPKWLTSIEVVNKPFQGYWEQRGWVKPAIVKTESRIDVPSDGAVVGKQVTVAGVAFAGERGISRVEVSADNGRTWNEAQLKTALSPYTWRQWLYRWTPTQSGKTVVGVRAVDGTGAVQTAQLAEPFPSGSSGYDVTEVQSSA